MSVMRVVEVNCLFLLAMPHSPICRRPVCRPQSLTFVSRRLSSRRPALSRECVHTGTRKYRS